MAPDVGAISVFVKIALLFVFPTTRGKEIPSAKGKGTDFFGLTHPTIQNLIQSSPGARKCTKYKWMKFTTTRSPDQGEVHSKHKTKDPGKKSRRDGGCGDNETNKSSGMN